MENLWKLSHSSLVPLRVLMPVLAVLANLIYLSESILMGNNGATTRTHLDNQHSLDLDPWVFGREFLLSLAVVCQTEGSHQVHVLLHVPCLMICNVQSPRNKFYELLCVCEFNYAYHQVSLIFLTETSGLMYMLLIQTRSMIWTASQWFVQTKQQTPVRVLVVVCLHILMKYGPLNKIWKHCDKDIELLAISARPFIQQNLCYQCIHSTRCWLQIAQVYIIPIFNIIPDIDKQWKVHNLTFMTLKNGPRSQIS